jgi:hypothetical protein
MELKEQEVKDIIFQIFEFKDLKLVVKRSELQTKLYIILTIRACGISGRSEQINLY